MNETATFSHPDHPKTLREAPVRAHRRTLLDAPHVAPLVAYGALLAERLGKAVPDVDPLDGGVNARLLILLETPGPKVLGTGFVSRDNPDGTAANMFRFLTQAGIARSDTVIWNIVPWLIQTVGERNRNPTRAEVAEGLRHLPDFLDLLPRLELADGRVLAGQISSRADGAVTLPSAGDVPEQAVPVAEITEIVFSSDRPEAAAAAIMTCLERLRSDASGGFFDRTGEHLQW